jgi:hypothetical protein
LLQVVYQDKSIISIRGAIPGYNLFERMILMKISKIEDLIDGGSYFIRYFTHRSPPIMSIAIVKCHDEMTATITAQQVDPETHSFKCVVALITDDDISDGNVEIIPLVDKNVFSSDEMNTLIECVQKLIKDMCSDYYEKNIKGGD